MFRSMQCSLMKRSFRVLNFSNHVQPDLEQMFFVFFFPWNGNCFWWHSDAPEFEIWILLLSVINDLNFCRPFIRLDMAKVFAEQPPTQLN